MREAELGRSSGLQGFGPKLAESGFIGLSSACAALQVRLHSGVCQDQPTGLVALANFFGVLARGSHKPTARVREG